MELEFITGNVNKFREIQTMIPELKQVKMDLLEIQSIDAHEIIREKLKEALNHHEGHFIIEDTSLYLDCMKGLPGPLIKWFLETIGSEGLWKIAKSFGNTKAEAKTIIGYAEGPGKVEFFEGVVKGSIVEPKGEGFGWDVIFMPEGSDKRFSEIGLEEKNKISMRRLAADKLKIFLKR